MTTTKTTATFSGIYEGFVYKDFVGQEVLTVKKVTNDSVVFDNGLEVTSLDAFELVERNYNLEALSSRNFEVKDGELFIEGTRVETGTLYVEEVLYVTGSCVGLSIRSLQEGKFDFFIYDFVQNHFVNTKLVFDKVLDNEEKIKNIRVLRFYNEEKNVVPEDAVNKSQLNDKMHYSKDGDKYVFVHEYETIVVLENGVVSDSETLYLSKRSELVKFGEHLILLQESEQTTNTLQIGGRNFAVSVDSDKILVAETIITPFFNDEGNLTSVETYSEGVYLRTGDTVKKASLVDDGQESMFIVTEKGFIYSNNGYSPRHAEGKVAKEAVKDYPYFIRLEAGTQRNVFTLANDKRETIKVEVIKTQDRGYTTNII